MTPDLPTLFEVIEATWPAADMRMVGPFKARDGQGGGKRVSAASLATEVLPDTDAIAQAEQAMKAMGQPPLFMLRPGQEAFDAMLAAQGYEVVDPTNIYLGPTAPLVKDPLPRAMAFDVWPPLAIQRDLWKEGGIGPDRLAVMERATCAKTTLLGRHDHTPSATAYLGLSHGVAMMHALEVAASCRRIGVGRLVVRKAAFWAEAQGGHHVAALCTKANIAANALYASMGLALVGEYHYRKKEG
jgi:GNAT superfamily N-acetyltransferase